jgi:hypothetical protein
MNHDVARTLAAKGWSFAPDSRTPYRMIASVVAEGGAAIVENISRDHRGRCEMQRHSHLIFRVCRHGRWAKDARGVMLPGERARQARMLGEVCSCPLQRFINEFHPVAAAAEWRRGLSKPMDTWLAGFLAQQPPCSCVPILTVAAEIGGDGRPREVVAALSHETGRCTARGEPAGIVVAAA